MIENAESIQIYFERGVGSFGPFGDKTFFICTCLVFYEWQHKILLFAFYYHGSCGECTLRV